MVPPMGPRIRAQSFLSLSLRGSLCGLGKLTLVSEPRRVSFFLSTSDAVLADISQ